MKTILIELFTEISRQPGLYTLIAMGVPLLFLSVGIVQVDELPSPWGSATELTELSSIAVETIALHTEQVLVELSQ